MIHLLRGTHYVTIVKNMLWKNYVTRFCFMVITQSSDAGQTVVKPGLMVYQTKPAQRSATT